MTRGNQRELARVKKEKRKQPVKNKDPCNKGQRLEVRKDRDADIMRKKQEKNISGGSGLP